MTAREAVNWLINLTADIGKAEHHDLWHYEQALSEIMEMLEAQPEAQWIPFNTRPLTEEEKEDHPEWACILDCKLPDDGQAILVSINVRGHEMVQYDEFFTDDGSYLDSDYEIGTEATAWMPLPEPWEGEKNGNKLLCCQNQADNTRACAYRQIICRMALPLPNTK